MPIRLSCSLGAIPAGERSAHQQLTHRLLSSAAIETLDLPSGFAFQLPAEEYESVVKFITLERLCCPFVRFELGVSPDGGPLRLRLTGPEGVRAFLQAELRLPARG